MKVRYSADAPFDKVDVLRFEGVARGDVLDVTDEEGEALCRMRHFEAVAEKKKPTPKPSDDADENTKES